MINNYTIIEEVLNFLESEFTVLKKFEKENAGGKIRDRSGKMVENMLNLIWEKLSEKHPDINTKIRVGSEVPLLVKDEDGNTIEESVDRHFFINDKLVLAIEAKTYLDKPYMQRASDDFKMMKTVDKNFIGTVVSLENAIADNTYNFLLNKKYIDSVFFLADGKRNSKPEKRIYNNPERINQKLILKLIDFLEGVLVNGYY